jgi:hypothetical protein
MIKGIAAINVYKKVAIVLRSSDTVTYEDSDGNIKIVKDLGEVASAAVRRAHYSKRAPPPLLALSHACIRTIGTIAAA